jgi:Neuraminidase (sialidase)
MDEGGGGFNTRQNTMFRSTDGGASFTSSSMGPRFAATGDVSCGYFVAVAPIIRHMGWGQPAVGPRNVVHYAYSGAGSSGDHGDIFYVRSADNGLTWSNPIEVNQDTDAQFKTQWMPSVSTDKDGKVTISWYDRRQATSACNVATDAGCRYERWARQSADNGATFQSEFVVSSSLIDQPEQDDPGVQSCYAGDYDYNTTQGGNAYITWTDGRRAVNGHHVQDVNFASVPLP